MNAFTLYKPTLFSKNRLLCCYLFWDKSNKQAKVLLIAKEDIQLEYIEIFFLKGGVACLFRCK